LEQISRELNDQYGDEWSAIVYISMKELRDFSPPGMEETLRAMIPGNEATVVWKHDTVKRGITTGPIRYIVSLDG